MTEIGHERFTVLVANPSGDAYGSDLQMLESVSAMTAEGWRVIVAMSSPGPLIDRLTERGAEIRVLPFPVLRRVNASPLGVIRLTGAALLAVRRICRLIAEADADLVYVNTVTLPWWMLSARLARVPAVCHVHEAEDAEARIVRLVLSAPATLATAIVCNSPASATTMLHIAPWLRKRTRVVNNGIAGPPESPSAHERTGGAFRLAVIGRLSPRKAPNDAVDAVALLRSRGRNVDIEVCGTPFQGYEWFLEQMRERANHSDVAGHVRLSGYTSPIWPALARAHAVVAPSLGESFGNVVVEAQLAMRPVIATRALGHLETITDGETGLLVEPGSPKAIADSVARIMDDPSLASHLVERGRTEALRRFSIERYRGEIVAALGPLAARGRGRWRRQRRPIHRWAENPRLDRRG